MSLGPVMIGVRGLRLTAEEREQLNNPLVSGVILFSRNFSSLTQLQELVDEIHDVREPPLLVTVDQEGGRVQRFREPFAVLPPMRELGRAYAINSSAAQRDAHTLGWLMAAELRSVGVDLSFAPVADLDLGIASVIGDRAFDANPDTANELLVQFVSGMKQAGMQATAKHFPTHAGALVDSHEALASDTRNYGELFDDLQAYRLLVDHGLASVMISHVVFPQMDSLPASLSKWWIQEQLRTEFGFSGAVISDDIGMNGLAKYGSIEARAQKVLEAGCDLVLICNEFDAIPKVLRSLQGYNDPAAQLRLLRLRGSAGCPNWTELRSGQAWSSAIECANRLKQPPALELKG